MRLQLWPILPADPGEFEFGLFVHLILISNECGWAITSSKWCVQVVTADAVSGLEIPISDDGSET